MKDFDYPHWLKQAATHSRRADESADLLHDAVLCAIRADREDFSRDETRRWFGGVLRNLGAMQARGAARRRLRETASVRDAHRDELEDVPSSAFLESLSPANRAVATLVVAGFTRDEIIAALQIAPTAFRQRLSTIRRKWHKFPSNDRIGEVNLSKGPGDLGLMRRALLAHVKRQGGIGSHDPDGHLIAIAESKNSPHNKDRCGNNS